jgi:hypothetical protein
MLPQVDRPGSLEKIVTSLQAILKFLDPFETPRQWQPMPLYSDWVRYDTVFGPPQFKLDPLGYVDLRGAIYSDSGTQPLITTLPIWARPPYKMRISCMEVTGATHFSANIYANGVVELVLNAGAKHGITLDGIRFDTRSL